MLELLDRHPGRRLVVEITEHAIMVQFAHQTGTELIAEASRPSPT